MPTTIKSSNIPTGTITADDLASTLDISGKTVTLPAASVTAHASDTDLGPVRNDIATLALHSAIADNKAAYNLSNAFIDQYEDDAGLDTQTTCDRITGGEYMASVSTGNQSTVIAFPDTGYLYANNSAMHPGSNTNWTFECWVYCTDSTNVDQGLLSNGSNFYGANLNVVSNQATNVRLWVGGGSSWTYDANQQTWANAGVAENTWIHAAVTKTGTTYKIFWGGTSLQSGSGAVAEDGGNYYLGRHIAGSSYLDGYMTGIRFSTVVRYTDNFTPTTTPFTSDSDTAFLLNSNTTNGSTTFTDESSNSISISSGGTGVAHSTAVASPLSSPVTSATGNYTSTTQTAAASVSSMGIVVLYKENAGSTVLNTDLVAQISANGGTNYSNATLVSGGTFSSGIKIAAVSGVSVTAGTTPKYKISFANQAASTKETQVHGVALLY